MNLYDFYVTVTDGVANDAALSVWSLANFGENMHVYSGMPHDAIPNMDIDTPFVLFGEPMRGSAQDQREIVYAWSAYIGLSNDDEDVLVPDNGERPAGFKLIYDCKDLVRQAVARSLPTTIRVTLDSPNEGANVQPVGSQILASMDFIFSQRLNIGDDPMT